MALKSLKKTLMYSNELSRDIIEAMVEDLSIVDKLNGSTIMEGFILDGLLTNNRTISYWIQGLYTGKWSTGRVISSVFEYNSIGINWKTRGLDLIPIIDFAIREHSFITPEKLDKQELNYVSHQLDSILSKFSNLENESLDLESQAKYKEARNFTQRLIEYSREKNDYIPCVDYYRLVKLYWDELGNWTIPFRMLSCIADIETGWRDCVESRVELSRLLRNLNQSWPDDN